MTSLESQTGPSLARKWGGTKGEMQPRFLASPEALGNGSLSW